MYSTEQVLIALVDRLLDRVPYYGATAEERASYQIFKGETFDAIAALVPSNGQARDSANYARYESRLAAREITKQTEGDAW